MNATETNPGAGDMRERMLDFAAYVLTSARALYREPQSYGPMRLADTLEKGLELLLLQAAGIRDETVEQAMSAVRESRPVAMTDPEGFAKALDRAIAVLVQATLEGKPEA